MDGLFNGQQSGLNGACTGLILLLKGFELSRERLELSICCIKLH